MKRLEDFTMEDLWALRQEIVLNSMLYADYENSFGIMPWSVYQFFEGFLSYAEELEKDEGYAEEDFDEFLKRYDNKETLWAWHNCIDFSWVEYE